MRGRSTGIGEKKMAKEIIFIDEGTLTEEELREMTEEMEDGKTTE